MQTINKNRKLVDYKLKNLVLKIIRKTNTQNLFLVFMNILIFSVHSQEQKKEPLIVSLDEFIKTSKTINNSQKQLRIENLVNGIQSSVYVEIDGTKIYGVKPISLFVSIKNLSIVLFQTFDKDNIEIVNIRISDIEDLKYSIDLENLKSFKKLKYVYIVSDIRCNKSDIIPLVKNIGLIKVFYKIAS